MAAPHTWKRDLSFHEPSSPPASSRTHSARLPTGTKTSNTKKVNPDAIFRQYRRDRHVDNGTVGGILSRLHRAAERNDTRTILLCAQPSTRAHQSAVISRASNMLTKEYLPTIASTLAHVQATERMEEQQHRRSTSRGPWALSTNKTQSIVHVTTHKLRPRLEPPKIPEPKIKGGTFTKLNRWSKDDDLVAVRDIPWFLKRLPVAGTGVVKFRDALKPMHNDLPIAGPGPGSYNLNTTFGNDGAKVTFPTQQRFERTEHHKALNMRVGNWIGLKMSKEQILAKKDSERRKNLAVDRARQHRRLRDKAKRYAMADNPVYPERVRKAIKAEMRREARAQMMWLPLLFAIKSLQQLTGKVVEVNDAHMAQMREKLVAQRFLFNIRLLISKKDEERREEMERLRQPDVFRKTTLVRAALGVRAVVRQRTASMTSTKKHEMVDRIVQFLQTLTQPEFSFVSTMRQIQVKTNKVRGTIRNDELEQAQMAYEAGTVVSLQRFARRMIAVQRARVVLFERQLERLEIRACGLFLKQEASLVGEELNVDSMPISEIVKLGERHSYPFVDEDIKRAVAKKAYLRYLVVFRREFDAGMGERAAFRMRVDALIQVCAVMALRLTRKTILMHYRSYAKAYAEEVYTAANMARRSALTLVICDKDFINFMMIRYHRDHEYDVGQMQDYYTTLLGRFCSRYAALVKDPASAMAAARLVQSRAPLHEVAAQLPVFRAIRPKTEVVSWLEEALSKQAQAEHLPASTKSALLAIVLRLKKVEQLPSGLLD